MVAGRSVTGNLTDRIIPDHRRQDKQPRNRQCLPPRPAKGPLLDGRAATQENDMEAELRHVLEAAFPGEETR
jgi:hypothetical protein